VTRYVSLEQCTALGVWIVSSLSVVLSVRVQSDGRMRQESIYIAV
jgi:hypothetical protein